MSWISDEVREIMHCEIRYKFKHLGCACLSVKSFYRSSHSNFNSNSIRKFNDYISCRNTEPKNQTIAEFGEEILAGGAPAPPDRPGGLRNWCENRCNNGAKICEISEKVQKRKKSEIAVFQPLS